MPVQHTFHVMLTSNCKVEVGAPDITIALAVARDALPFLQDLHDEGCLPVSLSEGDDNQYTLTCLLCHIVNPERGGRSHLVAMQEHQMAEHALWPEHFQVSCRVFLGTGDEGCYVWALPPQLATQLHLPHLSYMRARQHTAAPSVPPEKHEPQADNSITLVFVHPFDASQTRQDVYLVDQDVLAWTAIGVKICVQVSRWFGPRGNGAMRIRRIRARPQERNHLRKGRKDHDHQGYYHLRKDVSASCRCE